MADIVPPHDDAESHAADAVREEAARALSEPRRTAEEGTPPVGECPESTLWAGRTNWKHFGGAVLIYAVASLAFMAGSIAWLPSGWWKWSLILVPLVGAVVAARLAIIVLSTRYELTTERLFIERGLINLTKDQTELIRVDDVRVRKRLLDRVFGLGSIDVLSTDLSDRSVAIEGVADADRVAELIRSRMRTARKKSLFIENL